ncbi:MAG: hypothetical protein ACLGGV_01025 [Bacteroidia bacterium]
MNFNHKILIFFFVISSCSSLAQDDVSKYFDDKERDKSKFAIKTNIEPFFHREVPIFIEHYFKQRLSWEVGFGSLLDGYNHYLLYNLRDYKGYVGEGMGYAFSGQVRFYPKKGFYHPYIHVQYYSRYLKHVKTSDFLTGLGRQYLMGDHFKVDLGFSLGLRTQVSLGRGEYVFDPDMDFDVILLQSYLKLGYLF